MDSRRGRGGVGTGALSDHGKLLLPKNQDGEGQFASQPLLPPFLAAAFMYAINTACSQGFCKVYPGGSFPVKTKLTKTQVTLGKLTNPMSAASSSQCEAIFPWLEEARN